MEGYHVRPSAAVLTLREESPDFLVCELHGGRGRPRLVATSARTTTPTGQPGLVVCGGSEEPRKALRVLEGGAA